MESVNLNLIFIAYGLLFLSNCKIQSDPCGQGIGFRNRGGLRVRILSRVNKDLCNQKITLCVLLYYLIENYKSDYKKKRMNNVCNLHSKLTPKVFEHLKKCLSMEVLQ